MISCANKYFILFLFVLITGSCFSQDYLEKQFNLANNLYERKEYFDAITEFKRLIFFDKEKKYFFSTYLNIGKCYKGGGKLNEAIKYYSLASYSSKSDGDYFQSKIEIIKGNILRRSTDQALLIIDDLQKDPRFVDKKNELLYWRGWAHIFNDDWQKASEVFSEIDSNHPLKKLCEDVENEKYSVTFAKVISFLLPGAGQFYSGNYLSGVFSLAWGGLFIYLSVNSFLADRVFDGFITTGLFFRFHRGNMQNAEKFANEKNLEISNKMLKYLQENFIGEKP
ncbi:MAG: hypothetical protein NTX22_01220 [Ignavibacteriales bacterium]|nr:hypothetical protein [Ignavibacteriales bacterium]